MNKLIIASIVLLLAGIGLALASGSCAQPGSQEKCKVSSAPEDAAIPCICPGNAACAQTGCLENCKGTCASKEGAAIPCICPNGSACAQTGCLENCKGSCASKEGAAIPCICPNRSSCAQSGCLENCKGSCATKDAVMPAPFTAADLKSKCGSSGQGQASAPTKSPACVC